MLHKLEVRKEPTQLQNFQGFGHSREKGWNWGDPLWELQSTVFCFGPQSYIKIKLTD